MRPLDRATVERIQAALAAGATRKQAAESVGVSVRVTYKYAKTLTVENRGKGRWKKK